MKEILNNASTPLSMTHESNFIPVATEITFEKPVKAKRKFVVEDLTIKSYGDIHPYFEKLEQHQIKNTDELLHWLNYRSELETVIQEHAGWLDRHPSGGRHTQNYRH